MSNRTLRVNELLQRELSDILRKQYQSETVAVTITEIRVAPDLRDARVFVSVIGDEDELQRKLRWLVCCFPSATKSSASTQMSFPAACSS